MLFNFPKEQRNKTIIRGRLETASPCWNQRKRMIFTWSVISVDTSPNAAANQEADRTTCDQNVTRVCSGNQQKRSRKSNNKCKRKSTASFIFFFLCGFFFFTGQADLIRTSANTHLQPRAWCSTIPVSSSWHTVDSSDECSDRCTKLPRQVETDTFVLHKHFQLVLYFFYLVQVSVRKRSEQPLDRSDTATYQTEACPQQTSGFWKKLSLYRVPAWTNSSLPYLTGSFSFIHAHLSARISLLVAVKAKEVKRWVDPCWCSWGRRRLRRGGWSNGWMCGTSSQTWRTGWPWRGNGVPANREE